MLPFALVLLVASSAYALPAINTILYGINQLPATPDNGRLVNKYVVKGAFEYVDTAELSMYANILLESINKLADAGDASSQAAAALQTIAVLGELAYGIPGDACQSTAVINGILSGNSAGAVANYARRLASYIDAIVALRLNPNSIKYSTGSRGNCVSGGRVFDIESAWELISDNANVANSGLLNESYCSAKRLNAGSFASNNNLAAAVTAATLPPVNRLGQRAIVPLGQFLRVLANGGNPSGAAAAAKNALLRAV